MSLSAADIIDLDDDPHLVDGYANVTLAQVNDHVVKKSIMTRDFYWHLHPNSDEIFIVLEGTLFIDLKDKTLELGKGQIVTIPKNMPHRTRPKDGRSVNLTIERAGTETIRL